MVLEYKNFGGKRYKLYSHYPRGEKKFAQADVKTLRKRGKFARLGRLSEGGWMWGVYYRNKPTKKGK